MFLLIVRFEVALNPSRYAACIGVVNARKCI